MQQQVVELRNLNDLRNFVSETLCSLNDFEVGAFAITERILVRGDRPCGVFFCLHGPRSVRITAIWETDRNTVLFYGETGERMMRAQLVHDLELTKTAA